MSRVIAFEVSDELATVLKKRAVASGLKENEEARQLFEIGCRAAQVVDDFTPANGKLESQAERQGRPGNAGMIDRLDRYLDSDDFKTAFVANLETIGAAPKRMTR